MSETPKTKVVYGDHAFVIDGEEFTVEHDEFKIKSVGSDMDDIGARLSWIAQLWGAAEEERELVDAQYRAWRAKAGEKLLAKDVSSEWKVKQAIEADPRFIEFKKMIARTIRNCTVLKALFASLDAKSRLLQSKSATLRAEMGATGGGSGYHRDDESETKTRRNERTEGVRKIFKGKSKKVRTGSDEEA